uniref:Zgc:63972 n=1 Tax=Sphaeramia orbicularis TaxID=375764 RepID=A0A673BAU1_9TELE
MVQALQGYFFPDLTLEICLLLVLTVSIYPGLWSIGVQLYSAFTGSYVPGHHSVLLINSPNEQANKLLHIQLKYYMFLCFFFWSFRYFWKGEIQDASEFLMVSFVKMSVHPYANPEVLSFPVEDGSLAYMKWMDEAIPDD